MAHCNQVLQYRRVGLSTSSLLRSVSSPAMSGIRSTSRPSSGISRTFGCGQSVPQRTRSGAASTSLRGERHRVQVVAQRRRDALGAAHLDPRKLVAA